MGITTLTCAIYVPYISEDNDLHPPPRLLDQAFAPFPQERAAQQNIRPTGGARGLLPHLLAHKARAWLMLKALIP